MRKLLFLSLLLFSPLAADIVQVDLKEPVFENGVLSTEHGGVITTNDLRLQARKIIYTKKQDGEKVTETVEAEGQLMLDYKGKVFVGDKLFFDFNSQTGILENGRVSLRPWFVGGEKLEILADGSYLVHNAFLTTCESCQDDWRIQASEVKIQDNKLVTAKNVQFKFFSIPCLWLPRFKMTMDSLKDAPISAKLRFGGVNGTLISARYRVFSWNHSKVFLRMDANFERGVGGGIDTSYVKDNHSLVTENFAIHDHSVSDPNESWRWRLIGKYEGKIPEKNLNFMAQYDRLSDREMAYDYTGNDFKLATPTPTQLMVAKHEETWLANLSGRFRINPFESVEQKIPYFFTSHRPLEIGESGIISTNTFSAGLLRYDYNQQIGKGNNYRSSRMNVNSQAFRSFQLGVVNITPLVGVQATAYGNYINENEQKIGPIFMGATEWKIQTSTRLYHRGEHFQHSFRPYINAELYTMPTSSVNNHYIFDLSDGLAQLGMAKVGVWQEWKPNNSTIRSECDLYAYAFDIPSKRAQGFKQPIPRLYFDQTIFPSPTVDIGFNLCYSTAYRNIDSLALRTGWTINENIALSFGYLHRSAYSWRKVIYQNFFLDVSRSQTDLLNSALSDQRDTFLTKLYLRIRPDWIFDFTTRSGWNRVGQPAYSEYKADLTTYLRCRWQLKFTYEHLEQDTRFYISVRLGP